MHPDQFRPAPDQWPGHRIRFPRPWTESPERSLLADEAVGLVGLELVLLPQLQFLVVSLRDIGRLRAAGVCALLDLTAANQRVLLHSGRAWIRKVLTGYFQAVP